MTAKISGDQPILVTGGTGTLGRPLVEGLRAAGHRVRVLSRGVRPAIHGVETVRADLLRPHRLEHHLGDAGVIVHCAGAGSKDDVRTRNLVAAALRAGRPHMLYISVIGADRVPCPGLLDRAFFGYYATKRASEEIIIGSGLPWTILRAAQFHELMLATTTALAKMPVIPLPAGVRFQPVAAAEVAAELVRLSGMAAQGLVPNLAGPDVLTLRQMVQARLDRRGQTRPFWPLSFPGVAARALRDGANLDPDRAVGQQHWRDVLAQAPV